MSVPDEETRRAHWIEYLLFYCYKYIIVGGLCFIYVILYVFQHTRFPFKMMFVSFNSSTKYITNGTWTFTSRFNWVRSVPYVGFCVGFVCPSCGHCRVDPSVIYGFWLPLRYLQTFLITSYDSKQIKPHSISPFLLTWLSVN